MAELDPKKIAADWASRGFSCDLWTGAPGWPVVEPGHLLDLFSAPLFQMQPGEGVTAMARLGADWHASSSPPESPQSQGVGENNSLPILESFEI
jgi:hypothetical protein